jgi:hypothetical protein
MIIEVLNVTPLVRVRETFRPTQRMIVVSVFCGFVLGGWASLQPEPGSVFSDPGLRFRTLALMLPVAVGLCAAIPRQGPRAQVLFTAIAAFDAVATLWLGCTAVPASTPERDGLISAIGAAFLSWLFFGRGAVASLQSMIPLRRWRAHRLRLALCRRLWAGEWQSADAPPAGAGEPLPWGWREYARYGWGWAALAFSIPCWVATIHLGDAGIRLAVYRRDFEEAFRIARTGSFDQAPELPDLHPANSILILLLLLGVVSVRIFIEARERWRRRNVPIRRSELQISPASVLLLRSFHEEEKRVPATGQTLRGLSRTLLGRAYSFVDLVVDRCSAVGPVKLFGWKENLPPPPSGNRYYVGDEWAESIRRAIPVARLIVVLFGTTDSLAWELEEVRDGGHLDRTVILLPPDLYPPRARRRWMALAEFLCPDPGYRRMLTFMIRPKEVIGACFHDDRVVVFMGEQEQPAYESALDLAAILSLADPRVTRGMVTKYIRPDARPFAWLSRWRESRGSRASTGA